MSTGLIALIVVGVVVVLAGIYLFTTGRKDTARATGLLSRETVKRDRSRENPVLEDLESESPVVRGRDVERAAALERREPGREVMVAATAAPPAPYVLDEEAYGVNRRQFLNRSITGMFVFGLSGFGAVGGRRPATSSVVPHSVDGLDGVLV